MEIDCSPLTRLWQRVILARILELPAKPGKPIAVLYNESGVFFWRADVNHPYVPVASVIVIVLIVLIFLRVFGVL